MSSVVANQILIITGDATDAKTLEDVLRKAKDGPFNIEWVTVGSRLLLFLVGQYLTEKYNMEDRTLTNYFKQFSVNLISNI